jgi:uncharacterized protein YciI
MFIVSITYTAPEPHIAAQRPAHVQWLKDAFTRGNFKIAGSKTTKDGGILLSDHPDRESLEAELDLDPYRIHNVATHTVIGFRATMTA